MKKNIVASLLVLAFGLSMPSATFASGEHIQHADRVLANDTDTYTVSFYAHERAEVRVVGDGTTRLDLYVYDQNGNLVESAVGPGDRCRVAWVPLWTGTFRIVIANRGGVYNDYWLFTN